MEKLDRLVAVLEQSTLLREQLAAALELRERLEEREVTVAVMGQFKRGKSSIINAMLGEPLLPTAIIPLTTVVTELRWAAQFRAEVRFSDGRVEAIARSELEAYCSEEQNPGNEKQVQAVRLWTPAHPFGAGIVLVDTPGVGSIHQHNTEASQAYVEHSDAVLFLLSVDSPVSETERDFLLQARRYAAKFYFAVNKADTVSESDLNSFVRFCSGVLSEAMDCAVLLRPVSARTGEGICELIRALSEELRRSGGLILEDSVAKKRKLVQAQAEAKLLLALQAVSLPAEELEKKWNRLRAEQRKLESFGEEVQVLARHRTEQLVLQVKGKLDGAAEALKAETAAKGEELQRAFSSLPPREFEMQLRRELEQFLRDQLGTLDQQGLELLEQGYRELTVLLSDKATEAGHLISDLLQAEFGLDYPVEQHEFQVSQRSDFTLHLGAGGSLLLDMEALTRFLPRKQANSRYYRRSMAQAALDIERNVNNMLSNYRYKMQESLRPLCRELTEEVESMSRELSGLIVHISSHLEDARQQRERTEAQLTELLRQLRA